MPIRGDMRFDKRIVERNLKSGLVTKEELEKHFRTLKDASSEAISIEAEVTCLGKDLPSAPRSDEDEL